MGLPKSHPATVSPDFFSGESAFLRAHRGVEGGETQEFTGRLEQHMVNPDTTPLWSVPSLSKSKESEASLAECPSAPLSLSLHSPMQDWTW